MWLEDPEGAEVAQVSDGILAIEKVEEHKYRAAIFSPRWRQLGSGQGRGAEMTPQQ